LIVKNVDFLGNLEVEGKIVEEVDDQLYGRH
jgi:hypothetical protein